jgi:hypothetical protein
MSSRPDQELEGWPGFALIRLMPLTLQLAHDLVDLLPFEVEIKTKFQNDLRKELFAKHESFLSNPLLLSIMLLTYGQSAALLKT